jgi:protein-L-isoaspartate(D-aspartate) O-methyltransferase
MDEDRYNAERAEMVGLLRDHYHIRDERVLAAMFKVRRHVYVPEQFRGSEALYGDHPCAIGHGQTISQPFIVAYMTEKLAIRGGEKILEIGTGSGYQAAVLAELGARVIGIEIVPELAAHARAVLAGEGYDGVKVFLRDGHGGLPEESPFDAIIAGCAAGEVPPALVEQLKEGGALILPVGEHGSQQIVVVSNENGHTVRKDDIRVRFVPMVRSLMR